MSQENFKAYQLILPDFFDGVDKIAIEQKKPGEAPLKLSQSTLETLLNLYKSTETGNLPSPHQLNLETQSLAVAGSIFHFIAQATSIWRAILPLDTPNLNHHYHQNLTNTVNCYYPTGKIHEIKVIYDLLNDNRLIMPRRRGEMWRTTKTNIYDIITEKCLQLWKHAYPFTANPPLPQIDEECGLASIMPAEFAKCWDTHNFDQVLYDRVQHLFDFHESQVVVPSYNRNKYGGYASEIRYFGFIPRMGIIWSGRMDEVSWTIDPATKARCLTIVDYKIGKAHLMPEQSLDRQIQRLATHITALAGQALPLVIPSKGNSLKLDLNTPTETNQTIKIFYLGMGTTPPQTVDFSQYWQSDWYPYNQKVLEPLYTFITFIHQNQNELAPYLKPPKHTRAV